MGLRTRLACSLGTLMVGAVAALPFYRPRGTAATTSSSVSPPAGEMDDPFPSGESSSHPMALQIASGEPPPESLRVAAASTAAAVAEDAGMAGRLTGGVEGGAPPRIAREFPATRSIVPPADTASLRRVERPTEAESAGELSPASAGRRGEAIDAESTDEERDDAPRTYRIRDGDTLPRIARRYLGSEDRWREVLVLNRDLIRDPELLPVGVSLRLPPRGAAPISPDGGDPAPLPATDPPMTKLVPIE